MSTIEIDIKETIARKVEKTACDRCSKIIEDQIFEYYSDEYRSKIVIDIEYRNQGGGHLIEYDLCDTCSQQLKQWVEVA
jgi:hypothetical protein